MLLWDDAAGMQVREFLDGRVWSEHDLQEAAQLHRLGERLAQLHALEPPAAVAPFDPGACAQQYLRLIEASGRIDGRSPSAVRAAVRGAADVVAAHRNAGRRSFTAT